MKICLINNIYREDPKTGSEAIARAMVDGLRKKNQVFVITAATDHVADKTVYEIKSLYKKLPKIIFSIRLIWHLFDSVDALKYLKIKKILLKEKPDLIITHNLKGLSLLLPCLFKRLGIKYIHVLHDIQLIYPSGLIYYGKESVLDYPWTKLYIFFSRYLMQSPDIVISPSNWLMNMHLKRKFFKNSDILILPNPALFSNSEKISGQENEKFDILFIGPFSLSKGALFALRSFIDLAEKNKDSRLIMVGHGPDYNEAKKIAKNQKNIKLIFDDSHKKIISLMKEANCLVVPSLCYENSPTVIYEAASFGLPVIASRIGGITELIHGLGGLLFEPGSKEDLIKKIEWALINKEKIKTIGKTAKEKVKNYSTSNYIKKIEDLGLK